MLCKRFFSETTAPEPFSKATFWLNNVLPIRRSVLDPRSLLSPSFDRVITPEHPLLQYLPPKDKVLGELEFEDVQLNPKEGGVFVNLKYRNISLEDLSKTLEMYLQSKKLRSSFNFQQVSIHYVKGEPFMEDMYGRLPSKRVKVEFEGPDLSIEQLYRILRPYGPIKNIIPMPSSSKDLPRFATVEYAWLRSASAARNSVHGALKGNTRISISYEKVPNLIENLAKWVTDHPRISIPVILSVVALTTYLVFDPLRVWFIENKITSRFSIQKLKNHVVDWILGITKGSVTIKPISTFDERQILETRLVAALKETPDSITLLTGPRGSGKSELLQKVTEKAAFKLTIDCNQLINVSESEMLDNLANQIGFYPRMSFLVSASGLADSLITAATGVKAGVSTTAQTQVLKMLESLSLALTKISSLKQEHPVLVIEDFIAKERAANDYIYDLLAKWAVQLEENRICHVIIVSSNPSAPKVLSKAIPNRPVEHLALQDASPESALGYIKSRLQVSEQELKPCIEPLGGRLTDIELLIQKIKAGTSPMQALEEIILKAQTELRKLGLGDEQESIQWNPVQFYKLVQLLAKNDEVEYDRVRFSSLFGGNAAPLQQMEASGLLTIVYANARPFKIKPSKPVYREAFKRMVNDTNLELAMGVATFKYLVQKETATIQDIEKEMSTITSILTGSGSDSTGYFLDRKVKQTLEKRLQFLSATMQESDAKAQKYYSRQEHCKQHLKLD